MVSFNSLLLSTFSKNIRFNPDVSSSLKRNQTLATIYLCLACFFKVILFEAALWIILPKTSPPILSIFSALSSVIALLFLRVGKPNIAVAFMLVYLHIANFIVSAYFKQSTGALYCLFPILQVAFFISSSTKVRVLNTIACFLQAVHHIFDIHKIFEVTLTEEQFRQISTIIVAASSSLALSAAGCFVQRFLEANMVELAEVNQIKSENLTKEVIQAIDVQDKFVSSLNHEIRNALTSMIGSVDYLLGAVKNISHLKVLKNAKLSTEVMLNLANNILDAAKLKTDKIELNCQEANFEDVIKKAFEINSENFKAAEIFAEAFFDKNVPAKLWIDSSRLLQIIMNLISNALKFTPRKGKLSIKVSWHTNVKNKNQLLTSTENFGTGRINNNQDQTLNKSLHSTSIQLDSIPARFLQGDSVIFEEFTEEQEKSHIEKFKSLSRFRFKSLSEVNNVSSLSLENDTWAIYRELPLQRSQSANPASVSSSHFSQDGLINQRKEYLRVEIVDTGCGISPEHISKLFTLFSQERRDATSRCRGTGLGLWICKQLCQAMGGDIVAHSQINQGTKFNFCIQVNSREIREEMPEQNQEQSEGIKALVVDDYAFNRDLHKLLLERVGVSVIVASDGKEALEKYKGRGDIQFDFIMMDIQMPGMDGFVSVKKIREWEKEKKQKKVDIYFVSGEYFNEDDVMARFEDGVQASGINCLRKPVDIEKLKNIVNKYKKA